MSRRGVPNAHHGIPNVTRAGHLRGVERAKRTNKRAADDRAAVRTKWMTEHHATHTRSQAAEAMGCSQSTVKRMELQLGLPCMPSPISPIPPNFKPKESIYNEAERMADFARMFACWPRLPEMRKPTLGDVGGGGAL